MRNLGSSTPNLAGSLLVAHPSLLDPNFHRTVILLSAHSTGDGALGVIINRPLNKRLEDLQPDLAGSPLGRIPLYRGGPVQSEEMLLVGWQPTDEEGSFRLYFGISPEKATDLMENTDGFIIRAYMGYAGWSSGQLEGELDDNAWLVSPLQQQVLYESDLEKVWRKVLMDIKPELTFLADVPDDPSRN